MEGVRAIFDEQLHDLASTDEVDVRALELPLARIKKIMKIDDEVECQLGGRRCMVSSEAPVLFAKACEIFVLELTERAWSVTQENKRRTLQRSDVCAAVARSDMYDFLIDIVPRDDVPPPAEPPPQQPPPRVVSAPAQDKRAWQQRIAEHLFYSHPLAHRLAQVPAGGGGHKRPRDDGLPLRLVDDDDDDEDDDDDDPDQHHHHHHHHQVHPGDDDDDDDDDQHPLKRRNNNNSASNNDYPANTI
eukprot:CAMPEP_0118919784 /NCGR_PEP_ID=MMETSP1166-20130328/18740_1 /TAXON_ID=1104430 /ORGANISM="Chrysoreinhardia sp, Strain CCMP3193" /LENGTH=244 /DNA_ID=CAMNT_0006860319 /DNA_START=36 /DNA_END=770 /DNA_ORIENTATION=+